VRPPLSAVMNRRSRGRTESGCLHSCDTRAFFRCQVVKLARPANLLGSSGGSVHGGLLAGRAEWPAGSSRGCSCAERGDAAPRPTWRKSPRHNDGIGRARCKKAGSCTARRRIGCLEEALSHRPSAACAWKIDSRLSNVQGLPFAGGPRSSLAEPHMPIAQARWADLFPLTHSLRPTQCA
jgi:hypothetical protein